MPEEVDAGRPLKKKKRKSARKKIMRLARRWAVPGALLGVVALAFGLAIWMFQPGSGVERDLIYLPDGTEMVWSINPDAVPKGGAYADGNLPLQGLIAMGLFTIKDVASVPALIAERDLTRVTMGGITSDSSDAYVCVMTTRKPFTAEDLKKWIGTATETKVGKHTMFETSAGAYCLPRPHTIIHGVKTADVRAVLERNGRPTLSSGLRAAMGTLNGQAAVCFLIDGPTLTVSPFARRAQTQSRRPQVPESFAMQVILGEAVDLRAVYHCEDAEVAEGAKEDMDRQLAQAHVRLDKIKHKLSDPSVAGHFHKILDSIKTARSGRQACAQLTLDVATASDFAKTLGSKSQDKPDPPSNASD